MSELAVKKESMEELEAFAARNTLLSWLSSCDHKQLGILYMLTALVFFMVAGCEALFLRLQLAVPNNRLLQPETYDELFTLHGTTMISWSSCPCCSAFPCTSSRS